MMKNNFFSNTFKQFIVFAFLFISVLVNAQWRAETTGGSTGYKNAVRYNTTGELYVVLQDANNGYKATVQKKNGANWDIVGTAGFSTYMVYEPTIAVNQNNGDVYISYIESVSGVYKLSCNKWNGTSWVDVGTPEFLITGGNGKPGMAIDNNGNPVIVTPFYNGFYVYQFDGTNWNNLTAGATGTVPATAPLDVLAQYGGNGSEDKNNYFPFVNTNGDIYVAVSSPLIASDGINVFKYSSGAWTKVGSNLPGGSADKLQRVVKAPDGTIYVAYSQTSNSSSICKIYVHKWNGSSWIDITSGGTQIFNSTYSNFNGFSFDIAFDSNSVPYVLYQNSGINWRAIVKKYNSGNTNWDLVRDGGLHFGIYVEAGLRLFIDNTNQPYFVGTTYGSEPRVYVPENNPVFYTSFNFSPTSGAVGSNVNINFGENFTGTTDVKFNGTAATFTVNNDNSIVAVVPAGATTGKISVTNASGTTISNDTYTVVIPPPSITSFTPSSGAVGTTVTITGTGFDATAANNTVYFDGVPATITTASSTQLVVTFPAGTTGFSDLTVINKTNKLSVVSTKKFYTTFSNAGFVNYLTNSFAPKVDFTAVTNTFSTTPVTWAAGLKTLNQYADFNLDGKPDYVQVGSTSTSINPNTSVPGSISFGTQVILSTGGHGIETGDIDNDGLLDLIVFNSSTINVFKNTSTINGTISFASPIALSVTNSAYRVYLKDMNNDGLLDLITANGANIVYLLNNTPAGSTISFNTGSPVTVTSQATITDFAVVDLDNNSQLDIIAIHPSYYSLRFNTNAFSALNSAVTNYNIVAGDFDKDGDIDFVTYKDGYSYNVYQNTGSNSFTVNTISMTNSSGLRAALFAAEMNGNALPEFLGCEFNASDYIQIANNTSISNLSFANADNFSPLTAANNLSGTAYDVDGDGRPDLTSLQQNSATFSINRNIIGLPIISSFTPTSGNTGTTITITGTAFTGATAVTINGNAVTSFTVVSDTSITAVVPAGSTGPVRVTTPGGTNVSSTNFTYNPTITTTGTGSITSFSTCLNTPSTAQTFTVSGSNLTANITVSSTDTTNIEFSTDNTTYATSLTLAQTSGGVASTTIYIRQKSSATAVISASKTITIASTGATSTTFNITRVVNDNTAISAHPSTTASTVCQGTTISTLSVTASGGSLTYQWYSNTSASTTGATLISGATATTYTPVNSTPSALYYYCIVTGTCGTVTSNFSGLITVSATTVVGTASASATTLCSGGTTTLSLTGNTGTIQWQSSLNNSTWTNITGEISSSYATPALTATTYYRATVKSGVCSSINSNVLTITISPLPTITLGTVGNIFNNTTSFSIPYTAIANSPTLYSVSAGASALSNFTPIVDASFSGATGNLAVAIPANSTPGTYNFNLTVKNATTGCVSAVYPITLTIVATPPTITSFSPRSGAIGDTITITGSGFSTTTANNLVYLGGMKCQLTGTSTENQLTVIVPAGAENGKFLVTNLAYNLSAYSNNKFIVKQAYTNATITSNLFTAPVSIATITTHSSNSAMKRFHLVDLDDDADLDVAYYSANSTLNVLTNNFISGALSSSNFTLFQKTNNQPAWSSSVTDSGKTLPVDLNGDGKIDFVGSSSALSRGLANLNTTTNATISFSNWSEIRPGNTQNSYWAETTLEAFDYNNDGKMDFIGSSTAGPGYFYLSQNTTSNGVFSVTTGNTSNTYKNSFYESNAVPVFAEIVDLDIDGKSDYVYFDSNGLEFLKNTSATGASHNNFSWTYGQIASYTNGKSIVTYDINSDQKLDLIITDGTNVRLFINNSTSGTITFAAYTTIATLSGAGPIAVGDIDGDGKVDIVVARTGSIDFIKNTTSASTITFAAPVSIATITLNDIKLVDFDKDGKVDILGTEGDVLQFIRNRVGEVPEITQSSTSLNTITNCKSPRELVNHSAVSTDITITATDLVYINSNGEPLLIYKNTADGLYYGSLLYTGGGASISGASATSLNSLITTYSGIKALAGNFPSANQPIAFNITTGVVEGSYTVLPYYENFTVSGVNLTAGVTVTPPANFQVSTDQSTWIGTTTTPTAITLTPSSGTLATTTVYVRTTPALAAGSYSGTNITMASTGATSVTKAVAATLYAPTAIGTQPLATKNICINASTGNTISINATGSGLTYQWYSNTLNANTGGTSLGSTSGAQTATLTLVTSSVGTTYYYCIVSGTCGTVTSSVSAVTINPTSIAGTASAVATTICSGSTATLSLTGSTGNIQWQSSLNNSTWTDISGATSTSYTSSALTTTTYFRAVVTSGACTAATSNSVAINMTTNQSFGNALAFDGTGKIQFGNQTAAAVASNFTIEAWVNVPTAASSLQTILSNSPAPSSSAGYKFCVNEWSTSNGLLVLEGYNGVSGGSVSSTAAITKNVWQHVAVVVNGSSVTFYINGAIAGTATRSFVSSSSNPLTLGAFSDNQYLFKGIMDEVRLWNVSKSQQDIQAAMYGPLVGNETGLVAYFNFNQGTPGGTNTAIANLTDNGPNAFTGSLSEIARTGTAENFVQNSNVMAITGTVACVGSTVQLNHPQAGGTWSSATTSVATINSSGLATCLTAGTSVISYTYTYNSCQFTDTYSMTVYATPVVPTVANTSVAYCQNATATALTATAAASHTLRWYTVATGGTGSTTAITPVTTTVGTFTYYVAQVNASGCEGPRVAITVTVSAPSVAGTASATATTVCSGSSTTLSLTGYTGTIQWQQSSTINGTYTNISGATSASYTTPALTATTYYKAVVTSGTCSSATTSAVTVTVPAAPRLFNQALNFDGVNDKVTVPHNTSLNLPNTFTIEAWVKVDPSVAIASSYMGIATKVQWTSSGMGYGLDIDGGYPRIFSGQGDSNWSGASAPTRITTNTWVHVAGTYDGSNFRLYVDGQLVKTQASATGVSSNTQPFTIGSWSAENKYFKGEIDEVRVWNVTRTAAQIAQFKDAELIGNETGLIVYYDLNQGTPGGNNATVTTAIDKTSNALTGTLNSFALTGATSNWIASGPMILNSPSVCINSVTTLMHTVSGGAWSSSDASVLSVNSSTGEATANAVGTATISYAYTLNGCNYTSTRLFIVNDLPLAPVAATTVNLCQGAPASALTATALTGHTLQWYTVQSGGTASSTAPIPSTTVLGQSIYYVSQRNNTTSCEGPRTAITVNVNENPTISGVQNMTVGGNTITLSGTGTPDSTTPWASSNPAVATITSSGVVTAVGGGTTTITYLTASGCSKTATIRVVDCAQPFANALAFGNGTSAANADFVQVNSRIFPSQTVANFTIETWIKPAASDIMSGTPGNSWLSFLGYTGTKRSPSIYITNNGVLHASWSEGSTLIGTPVSASSPTSLVANKWTHVALVKDGTTMRLFVDGIQIQSITCAANLDLPDNAYWLGKSDQQFSGALDEVRFWSTTRTQAQIQATMNAELAGTEAGLLAYFDFNEGIAGGTNTSITSIINKANNTLNGTLTNFTRTGTTSNFVGNSVSSSDITGAATICGNTTAQYTHQIPGGTWSVSNGATATISTSGLLTATTNENITLSYTYALNGCSFTATKTVAINSPAAPVTNTTINLCQGATTSALTATALSGHTLQWYTVATGGTASSTAPTPSVTTLGTTMYYVSQKNNTTNCESARTAITVTINAVPTISGAQSITVGGTPLQLTGSGTADTLTPWTSSNTAAATVSSTGVVTAVGAGSTIITYTAANGCTATAVISVVDCSQPFGNALQFDGVDDSFSTASNLSALNITGNITLETWIKFDQVHSDYVRVIGKGDNSNRTYGLWLGTNGKLLFQIWSSFGSGLGLESTTALQPGVWYHISATRSGNTAKIYINGIEDASTSTTVTPQTNTLPLTVGYGGIHTWLKGALDEVRVWNVARSLSQIQQGMYNALVGNETGLVAYYDFNQGIAGGNNSTINAALDRTTNVLHGTLTNFAKTGMASNFVGNTAANFVITGAATLCANSTSQYTHQVSGGTWSLSSGANATISTSGLLTAAANEDITVSYTYVVNGCTFIATKAVSIVTPAITVQPSTTSQNVCVNGITATLAVTATGLNNTYQWYKNTTASTTGGTLITGATNSVYMPSNTLVGTTYYYCVVSNTCSSPMTSNVSGAITISPVSVAGTITGTTSICSGATTTLTLSGNVGTIQWQRFDNPVWTDLTGETNTSFTTPVLTQNTTYRAVVISGYCSSAMTSSFNVVVNPLPVISGTTSVGTGESITLSATTTAASSNAWVSSNTVVATVSNMGVVTGLTTGTTTITYTNNNGCSDTEIITVTLGTTIAPVLTSPVTNTTGATTLNFNYTLPEPPLAGSVALIFTPTGGGTPILWTMTNATSATFSYVVGTNPTTLPNVVSGTALGFTTYDVTLIYQDAFSNPATSVTNTNIQTLAPPSISFANTNYTGIINQSIAIQTVNAGGGMVTYSISPILPTGLSLNTATGVISGTPTVTLAQTSFTVTATNAAGTDSESFNLFIDADTDGDGIGNATDTDIDGDGTANGQDTNPTNPCIGYNSSTASSTWQTADCDGDGILNGSDADVDGNGTIDNGTDIDGDGINDANDPDIDGDGIPNGADSDPDGNGTINNGPDTDGDGINDANDPDIDGDGIPNGADSDPDGNGTINNGPDTDGDGINDANDPDIDGDGIPNGADADANGDGTIDNGAVDTDGDGIVDGADSDVNGDGVIDNGPDTDGDGINDANDPDIDGDGIPNGADADPDGDGTINNGPDTDGDGINDANDPDIDGDGVPNGADADPDGNGTINNGPDTDGDGINDANDPDIDGDGIPNGADADPDGDGTINNGPDTDGDGINDAADADPDGNGTIDNGPDTDGDGINDANDPDIDGDGIPNAADVDPDGNGTNNNGTDMDGDGINDANDPDMDGDGIPNGVDNCPNIVNPSVITQPSSQAVNICPNGTPPTLTIQANGQQLEYQWYVNTINSNVGGTPITGATSTSFVPSNALVGPHYYYVVVNGTCGMSKSEVSGAITVQDITLPTVVTQNISVALNASGTATITAAQINNGSTDNCSIASVTVSPSSFTCANIGTNTVTLTVTDGNGNVNTGTATVTVTESTLPTVVTQNISVALNASGTATIAAAQINNGSTDNCSIASMTVSPSSFTCTNIGTNIVTLTVTDGNGNINTGTATVTVTDTILPTVVTQNASVTLNAQGTATVTATQVNNGSFDNCSIATITVSPSSFTCANIGTNTVTVTVTDASGNVSSSTAIVTVVLDNSISANNDLDAIPDNCDDDDDNDGILDVNDNCQFIANQDQLNTDNDTMGDICDPDDDNDGIDDVYDNCPKSYNPYQEDRDNDGQGDSCDTIEINVSDAISPNGDGINDTWVIYNIENHPNAVVKVFNRWGKEVFKARHYQNNWGGEFGTNTETLPEGGSYYYQIDLDGDGSIDKDGWLYISRK